jgi:alpha-tubulin suppressor-like RCC1 family protein
LLNTHTGEKLELVQIECGTSHTVGLTKNGEVFSWGDNDYGQLGHGDREGRAVPKKVESLDELVITKISCGKIHTAFSAALTEQRGDAHMVRTVMMILDLSYVMKTSKTFSK